MGIEDFSTALRSRSFPVNFPGHYIAGQWMQDPKADTVQGSINPSRGDPIVKVHVSKKIIEAGVDAADAAQKLIATMSLEQRIETLSRIRQVVTDYQALIIDALCIEAGKPRWEAAADFHASLQQLDALLAERERIQAALLGPVQLAWPDTQFSLQPNGITMAFLPFSTPLATFILCLSGALIAGSPLVLMPSSHAVLSGVLFSYILEKSEIPTGAVNVIFGSYQTFMKALADKRIQNVIYSGSREHCDAIRRDFGNNINRQLLLQSGGKNSVIVDSSASVKEAVRCVLYGVIKTAGQLNTSTSKVYIPKAMIEEFKKEIIQSVRALRIGPTDGDENPHLGPLYAQKAVDKFLRYQTMAKREACDTWVWGKVQNNGATGYFVTPGIHFFEDLEGTSSYQSNVLMCPDLSVYAYEKIEDAIQSANNTDAAMVTSLIGEEAAVRPWVTSLRAPNVLINLPTVGLDVYLPVAGRKLCGDYRLNGLGIAFLLTYPQASKAAHPDGRDFEGWPQID